MLSEHEGIAEGHTYSFLLAVLGDNVENVTATTHPLHSQKVWRGAIVQTSWVFPQQDYLAVDPEEFKNLRGILSKLPLVRLSSNMA